MRCSLHLWPFVAFQKDTMGHVAVEIYNVDFILCVFSMLFTTPADNQTHPKYATCLALNLSELLVLIRLN